MTKGKKVLITGGSGFIGKHLINDLQSKGYLVSCLDRGGRELPKSVRYIKGDIVDRRAVAKAMKGQDLVFHLAGVLGTTELQFTAAEATSINVIGSIHVFDEAVKNKTKVVLISKLNPWLNTYSITKKASEKFCQMYQKDHGLEALIVKWFNVYGPGQKHYGVQKAIPFFTVNALQGKPLPVFGSGRQLADFVYVTDTTDVTVRLAEIKRAYGKTIQIGTGRGTSVNRLASLIINLTGSKSKIKYLPMRMGEDNYSRIVADLTELRKLIKFQPKVGLKKGMIETIEYYKKII